ncbi:MULTISPECIES: MBL fold metallo-hydrolase [Nocardioides]|uniref:MBL fold metallo-hydrolase n=1 Tax=Nocardioides vastitatis TaxID=2568655 RepID=A0ABW0ZCN4_9ACTN|nr:MBL fold metallo-hydrolase [Nocardioides sp.]THJ08613.1 MBL fold metallo-hydrolase [Nocardioides sp.]
MKTTRRRLLSSAVTLSGVAAAAPLVGLSARAAARELPVPSVGTHLVLLGTAAGPVPMAGRRGICTALVVDGRTYLIDVGRGAVDQFETAGLSMGTLGGIFVTHLHSDHLADLYTLLWLRFGGYNSMTHPVDIYGPGPAGALPAPSSDRDVDTINRKNSTPGLADFLAKSMEATAYDLNIRMRDEAWPDIRTMVRSHEIPLPDVDAGPLGNMAPAMKPFKVMADDRVRVSAILVQHPPVFPSFAFRFDTDHGSVVFSGDTTVTPNMVTLAQGADVLVHEVIDLQAVEQFGNLTPEQLEHHRRSHTDVTKVGPIAREAGVATLVLNHLAPSTPAWSDAIWLAKAQQGFTGKVIVGNDLMRVPL